MLNFSNLKSIIPDNVYNDLLDIILKYDISTPGRLAHFLAQCAHESSMFSKKEENLNYSSEGLLKVFKKYFDHELASLYARNPKKIANRVYANRMGNSDEASGDGWNYRGRGYIQLTGKNNYKAFDLYCSDNIIQKPDLVSSKYPLEVSGWFWGAHNLNSVADKGNSPEIVTKITKLINGGTNGLQDRIALFNKFLGYIKNE